MLDYWKLSRELFENPTISLIFDEFNKMRPTSPSEGQFLVVHPILSSEKFIYNIIYVT